MMDKDNGRMTGRRLHSILYYAGLRREEYDRIRPEADRSNRGNLVFFSAVAAVMIGAMFLISFVMEAAEEFRWLYLTGALLSALCAAGACWLVPRRPPLLGVIVMAFIAVVFLFGIALGTFCGPDKQSVTFIVLLLTVPLYIAREEPASEMLLAVQLTGGFGDIYITDAQGLAALEALVTKAGGNIVGLMSILAEGDAQ